MDNPTKLTKIEIDPETDDISFYFEGSDDPWSLKEFERASPTRNYLHEIIRTVKEYNEFAD